MVQILVIDDEEPIRKLLARIIELEGNHSIFRLDTHVP